MKFTGILAMAAAIYTPAVTGIAIGIDLGTTYSCGTCAWLGKGRCSLLCRGAANNPLRPLQLHHCSVSLFRTHTLSSNHYTTVLAQRASSCVHPNAVPTQCMLLFALARVSLHLPFPPPLSQFQWRCGRISKSLSSQTTRATVSPQVGLRLPTPVSVS